MSQIFYRQMLVMPSRSTRLFDLIGGGGPDVPTPHAGPGGVATTPSAAIFQGVDGDIIGTALVAGQTGSRLRTSDLRLRTTCRAIPEVKTSGFGRRTSDVGPHAAGTELFGYCCRDSISEFNIRPSFPDLSMRSPASDSEKNFRFFAIKICVSSSSREPR